MPEQFNLGKMEPGEVDEAVESVAPMQEAPGVVEAEDYEGVPIETKFGEIKVYTPISEEQRSAAIRAVEAYTEEDYIDHMYIGIETSSQRPALFVSVNKGNVGNGTNQEVIGL